MGEGIKMILGLGAVVLVLLGLAFGVSYIQAGFEAASYRKFCDTPVTAWDALFLDLRIDECPEENV